MNDIKELLHLFEEDSALNDFDEIFDHSASHDQEFPIQRVQEAILQMHNLDPEFNELLHLVINVIFSAPSVLAGGGSTSAAIGCIWVNLRKHWQMQDVLEFLVHETTHNLVFLDELCYGHYTDYALLPKNENFAWSAILNKLRPIDKVIHSIVVSTEVLLFRENCVGHPEKPFLHPPTNIMIDQAIYSIEYLNQNPKLKSLLTSRTKHLLDICEHTLQHLKEKSLNKSEYCV